MAKLARTSPPWWRVALAFLVAPYVAFWVFILGAFLEAGTWPVFLLPEDLFNTLLLNHFLIFAYAPAFLLGIPAYLVLKNRVTPSLLNCGLVGASVAFLGFVLLWVFAPGPSERIVVDAEAARFFVIMAALGAVGGLVFWAVAFAAQPPDAVKA